MLVIKILFLIIFALCGIAVGYYCHSQNKLKVGNIVFLVVFYLFIAILTLNGGKAIEALFKN